ncbi:enoyl-CoA hydratase-related protein, partial [Nocardiopsis lucentensis]|uniref:enoyl-CoA hydratase-related protein n=1 Tax=Nocardiopsis lucentensis TaxID=53441 RepID=UPI0003608C8E
FEAVLACDLVVAAEDAKFGIPEVKRGLVAGAGGLLRLHHRIPRNIAMEMALTGDFVDATRLAELGLVNQVTIRGGALAGAKDLAARITPNGPLALKVSKEVIQSSDDWSAEEMWDRQNELAGPVFVSQDAMEGAAAFAEKRAPVWKGE